MSGALGPGAYVAGGLLLGAELGAAATVAALAVRRRTEGLRGPERAVALGLLGALTLVAIQLLPLALGILTRGTALLAAGLLALAATRIPPRPNARPAAHPLRPGAPPSGHTKWFLQPRWPRADAGLRWPRADAGLEWLLALAAVLATAGFWIAYLEVFATYHPVSVDALSFHFPGVIRYLQSGTLWQTAQYLPGQAQANYPQSGDMLMLALTLPWHSLAFVRLADPALLALAGVAVYATARELGAPPPASALATVALLAIRPVLGPALGDVLTDPAFVAGFAAGNLFLLRHWRTGAGAELALAGAGYGLALGSKWYGLTDVPLVIAAWIAVSLLARRPRARLARETGVLAAVCLLVGGVWMLRNLILTGNPVFDYRVSVLGATVFPAPPNPLRSQLGFTLAHYLGDPGVLRDYVWPVFRADFGLTGALLLAAVAIAAASARSRGRRAAARLDASRIGILAAGAVLCAAAYALTPYGAQGPAGMPVLVDANTRYGAPALLLAAPLLARLIGRAGRLRAPLELLLAVLTVIDLRRYVDTGAGRIALSAGLAVVVLAALRARPRLALGATLVVVALAGYHYQRVLARRPYLPGDPTVDYVLARAPAHTRIAITGQWTAQGLVPVAPLFGPRLENDVRYIGRYDEHRLQAYAEPAPFLRALAADRPALLEVGTGFPPRPDPLEARWAAAAGYRVVARSARLVLMRPPG